MSICIDRNLITPEICDSDIITTLSCHNIARVMKKFYGGIEDVVAFGVKVPGIEGRRNMAAITILKDLLLDWKGLACHVNKRIPIQARPVFIRICFHFGENQLLKNFREQMQSEGFNPLLVDDPLYYYDVTRETYLPLSPEVYLDIIMQELAL